MSFYFNPGQAYREGREGAFREYLLAANANQPVEGPYRFRPKDTVYTPIASDTPDLPYQDTDAHGSIGSAELAQERIISGVRVNLPGLHELMRDDYELPKPVNNFRRAA